MKLDKAIEVLKELPTTDNNDLTSNQQDAVKLGIEALYRVEDLRTKPSYRAEAPLPGETPEEELEK